MSSRSIDTIFSLQLSELKTFFAEEPSFVQKMERMIASSQHIIEIARLIKKDISSAGTSDEKNRLEGIIKLSQLQLLGIATKQVVGALFKNFQELMIIKKKALIPSLSPPPQGLESQAQLKSLLHESETLFERVFDIEKSISFIAFSKKLCELSSSPSPPFAEGLFTLSPPSVRDLITMFRRRPIRIFKKADTTQEPVCASFDYTSDERVADMALLEEILRQHNVQFRGNNSPPQAFQSAGWMEKTELQKGSHFFTRADLHGDLFTLVSSMMSLRNYPDQPYVDGNFRCHANFHVFALGDFMDRGDNEIGVLALLLKWRMENPLNVHLIRGNHESVGMNLSHSNEKKWAITNDDPLTSCYQTFSISSFVGSKETATTSEGAITISSHGEEKKETPSTCTVQGGKAEKRKYIQLVHGCCTTLFDSIPFLEATESRIEVRKTPSSMRRLTILARSTNEAALTKSQVAARTMLRGRELEGKIMEEQKKPPHKISVKSAFLWNDVGNDSDFIAPNNRGRGVKMSPQLIQAYLRSGSNGASVGCIIRAHQHHYSEVTGENGKVITTTLPVAPLALKGGEDPSGLSIQGLLVTVFPNMKDCKKRPLYFFQKELRFSFGEEETSLYDPLPSLPPPQSDIQPPSSDSESFPTV